MNCTYLRQAEGKYFCLKRSKSIDINYCNSCKYRKHSGVKEFITSAAMVAKNPKLTLKDLEKQRWEKCKKCEYLKNRRCKICGCFLDVKIKFQAMRCPKGKW